MKLKEKLAEAFATSDGVFPDNYPQDEAIEGFIAGFEKAREMISKRYTERAFLSAVGKQQGGSGNVYFDIDSLGEEEVE
jgi:hypothetical protein